MLEICLSLKRKLQCKPHPKQVHDPKTRRHQKGNQRTRSGPLEHSNIQGSKRHTRKSLSFNSKLKGAIDISDPIIHEIVLDGSNSQSNRGSKDPEGSYRTRRPATPSITTHPVDDYNEANVSSHTRMSVQMDSDGPSMLTCYKCGEKLKNLIAVEAHHISEHSGND